MSSPATLGPVACPGVAGVAEAPGCVAAVTCGGAALGFVAGAWTGRGCVCGWVCAKARTGQNASATDNSKVRIGRIPTVVDVMAVEVMALPSDRGACLWCLEWRSELRHGGNR